MRMSRKGVNFDDKKIKRSNFSKNKKVFQINNIDVNKTLLSKEEPYGTQNSFKHFIGYDDNDGSRLLCLKLPQMTDYAKNFEFNSTLSFKISDKQLLRKYNQIWEKKYIKAKIKTYGNSVITNFHN